MPTTEEINTLAVVGPYIIINVAVEIVFVDEVLLLACAQFHNAKPVEIALIAVVRHTLPCNEPAVGRELRINVIVHLHISLLQVDLLVSHRLGCIDLRGGIVCRLAEIDGLAGCKVIKIDVRVCGDSIL